MKYLFLIFLFLTSCDYAAYHDSPFMGDTLPCDINSEIPPEDQMNLVTYDQLKTEVLQPKCIGCHSSGSPAGGVDLSTYSAARPWANQIKSAVVSNFMPRAPSPPLNQQEKDLVISWVDAGALNGSGQNCSDTGGGMDAPPINDPLTEVPQDEDITYALVREKIFKLRCFACHSTAGGNADGLNLETYFNTIDEIEDIYEEVFERAMPPAPRPSLNDIERTTLLKWIELGAPQ